MSIDLTTREAHGMGLITITKPGETLPDGSPATAQTTEQAFTEVWQGKGYVRLDAGEAPAVEAPAKANRRSDS